MKRIHRITALLCIAMLLTAAGCNNNNNSESSPESSSPGSSQTESSPTSEVSQQSKEEESSQVSEEASKEPEKVTLAELFTDPAFRDENADEAEDLSDYRQRTTITLNGESGVTYTRRYHSQQDPKDKTLLQEIDDFISDQTKFQNMIELLEKKCTTTNITITVRILNADGSVLSEKTYDKNSAVEPSSKPEESSKPAEDSKTEDSKTEDSKSEESKKESSDKEDSKTESTPVIETSQKTYATVEEFVKDPAVKAQLDSMLTASEDESGTMKYYVENKNTLVLEGTFKDKATDAEVSEIKASMDSSSYESTLKSLIQATGIKDMKLVLRLKDKDGKMLYEKGYSAEE